MQSEISINIYSLFKACISFFRNSVSLLNLSPAQCVLLNSAGHIALDSPALQQHVARHAEQILCRAFCVMGLSGQATGHGTLVPPSYAHSVRTRNSLHRTCDARHWIRDSHNQNRLPICVELAQACPNYVTLVMN